MSLWHVIGLALAILVAIYRFGRCCARRTSDERHGGIPGRALFRVLTALAWPFGRFMARVYRGERTFLTPVLGPFERLLYRVFGVTHDEDGLEALRGGDAGVQPARHRSRSTLLQRLQGVLPLNPQDFGAVSPDSSFNTAVSFATNTNWQGYGGETTMSYLTQMLGLACRTSCRRRPAWRCWSR